MHYTNTSVNKQFYGSIGILAPWREVWQDIVVLISAVRHISLWLSEWAFRVVSFTIFKPAPLHFVYFVTVFNYKFGTLDSALGPKTLF